MDFLKTLLHGFFYYGYQNDFPSIINRHKADVFLGLMLNVLFAKEGHNGLLQNPGVQCCFKANLEYNIYRYLKKSSNWLVLVSSRMF